MCRLSMDNCIYAVYDLVVAIINTQLLVLVDEFSDLCANCLLFLVLALTLYSRGLGLQTSLIV